jgi:hypothetical protein
MIAMSKPEQLAAEPQNSNHRLEKSVGTSALSSWPDGRIIWSARATELADFSEEAAQLAARTQENFEELGA